MFERYNEKARRVIFFARYEASQFGSPYIETEHLLLGLLREDKPLANRFMRSEGAIDSIRNQIEANVTIRKKVPTSVDLPLSHESKRVLVYSAEEATRLNHQHIDTQHLLLGLLRMEGSLATQLLRERGLHLDNVREQVHQQLVAAFARRGYGFMAGLDRWLSEHESRGDIWVVKQEYFANSKTSYAIYAGHSESEKGEDRTPAEKLVQTQKRIEVIVGALQHAIAHHEFEKARANSEEERRERENLRLLREQFQGQGLSLPVPILCVEIVRDDYLSEIQERCNRHIAEGAREVWILEPDFRRAYTFTETEGIREFKGEILRIAAPPLEMDLKEIFD